MDQLKVFSEAARENRSAELKEMATASRASQATEKGWKGYMEMLDRSSHPVREPKVISRAQAKGLNALLSKRTH